MARTIQQKHILVTICICWCVRVLCVNQFFVFECFDCKENCGWSSDWCLTYFVACYNNVSGIGNVITVSLIVVCLVEFSLCLKYCNCVECVCGIPSVCVNAKLIMGNKQSEGILKRSPLGCILAHWKDLEGPGGNGKKTMIKYCNQWWPLYKLEDGEK